MYRCFILISNIEWLMNKLNILVTFVFKSNNLINIVYKKRFVIISIIKIIDVINVK